MEKLTILFHKCFMPLATSLLVGMLNTYHNEAREQRAINLAAVQKAAVQNSLQDEKLIHIAESIAEIKDTLKQQQK